jgi:hypothetical protein
MAPIVVISNSGQTTLLVTQTIMPVVLPALDPTIWRCSWPAIPWSNRLRSGWLSSFVGYLLRDNLA